jgi:hypothetical protein
MKINHASCTRRMGCGSNGTIVQHSNKKYRNKSDAAIGAAVEEFSPGLLKSLLRTNKTQTFVWEPGRTADRSAALSG